MIVFAVAVILVVGVILFTLFVRTKDLPEAPPVSPTAHLEQRKAQIYENLRDLQFEFRVGKLSDDDYKKTKLDLQGELAKVLAEIDAIQGAAAPAAKPAQQIPAVKTTAATIQEKASSNGHLCHHCGAKFAQSMKFCGECGNAMAS